MSKASNPTHLTGAAGVHFLAGCFSAIGLQVAITQKNAPYVDLLVSSLDGSRTVPIQVKTMRSAKRSKGGCEWRCNPRPLKKGFYAFVDLRLSRKDQYLTHLPDVYFVRPSVVKKWKLYPGGFLKPSKQQISPYENNWLAVTKRLSTS
jgi:hypothetical protein